MLQLPKHTIHNPVLALLSTFNRLEASTPLLSAFCTVTSVSPHAVIVSGLPAEAGLGDLVEFQSNGHACLGELLRIERGSAVARPFDSVASLSPGSLARYVGRLQVVLGDHLTGRSFDALLRPLDGSSARENRVTVCSVDCAPPRATERIAPAEKLLTGVKCIDVFTPLMAGQRIGLFAGSGVGKSTLLSMMCQSTAFDRIVVALVGERSREVRAFLSHLPPAVREKSIAVVATGDESPSLRRLAPRTAMRVAEFCRDRGERVLLVVDSITRYAHACRDLALSAGEAPVARGFPPSVFSDLPRLLERAGPGSQATGTITGIFTVLVDGDDHNDPVADCVRGILDGHVVLDRGIAEQSRLPAFDPLRSVSRLADQWWAPPERLQVAKIKRLISRFEDTRDLRLIGGYTEGRDAELDLAVRVVPELYTFFGQTPDDPLCPSPFDALIESVPLLQTAALSR